jgi:hypothetical protein
MKLVYYAHSYRPDDAEVVRHFADLLTLGGLTVSLDPPSDELNAAKPMRHLRFNDAVVAVLTKREDGPSKYILFEIMLGIRAKKPVLVFVEDGLTDQCVPHGVLQRRFSRRSLLREIKVHRHAIAVLNTYLPKNPPPPYQIGVPRKNCLFVGYPGTDDSVAQAIRAQLEELDYTVHSLNSNAADSLVDDVYYDRILNAEFALIMMDKNHRESQFVIGTLSGHIVPSIAFTSDEAYIYSDKVPREYQPIYISNSDPWIVKASVKHQVSIYLKDYLDLEDTKRVDEYAKRLHSQWRPQGLHSVTNIQEMNVENSVTNNIANNGSVGTMATGLDVRVVNNQTEGAGDLFLKHVNYLDLANELDALRKEIQTKASTPDQLDAVSSVMRAEIEARASRGSELMQMLSKGGKWALDTAVNLGLKLAENAIIASLRG